MAQTGGDGGFPDGPKGAALNRAYDKEEAIIVAFRRPTLPSLDDGLYGLQPTILLLSRFSLRRCLERQGISRLPVIDGGKSKKQRVASCAIGYFHIDNAEVGTAEGLLGIFVAIDRTDTFAFVRPLGSTGKMEVAPFFA